MKTIGLIGGTTWLSTIEYYSNINRMVNQRLGGDSSAKILLYSMNFEEAGRLPVSRTGAQGLKC
jgi:aspartate racemase